MEVEIVLHVQAEVGGTPVEKKEGLGQVPQLRLVGMLQGEDGDTNTMWPQQEGEMPFELTIPSP